MSVTAALAHALDRIASEPPFRLLGRAVAGRMNPSLETRMRWELSARPVYLLGLGTAALQAKRQGIPRISTIEFGVAAGNGLCILQREAARIEKETGVGISVYGFDRGAGLPSSSGDYRDHPDVWQPGDYPKDVDALKARLDPARTTLLLGDIRDTVKQFATQPHDPIGFVALDVDLYSSAADALALFQQPTVSMLRQTVLYLDDVMPFVAHRYAGELLAVEEFNRASTHIKIDRWHGAHFNRPFPDRPFLSHLYVAHDLEAISACTERRRETKHLALA